ncbi:MAG: cobyric acid synthase [Desulfobacterales bacterium]|nr:cobyric acid synthase [Desulfobacterales bacterium]
MTKGCRPGLESRNKILPGSCLSVLGTGSDVGKSIVATALCRFFAEKGAKVAPFKAQNMSNNSGVTPEGLEMGRAQIVQAEAAGLLPHVDMNPILLKPTSEMGAQVVVLGKALTNSTAKEYHEKKQELFHVTCTALDRLREIYEVVIMEGAGSCAEVNLMANDIVNFPMAEYADASVILVADIHRGGVFAQIVGTLECLPQKEQDLIAGFIINRFRGDIALFEDGVRWIEQKTGKPVFGVLPWFDHISIDAEDSVVIEKPKKKAINPEDNSAIGVLRIPHISNFTDFNPLENLEGVDLHFIEQARDLTPFAAVILPGSKNTRFDLNWLLNESGWAERLLSYAQEGGHILGICGGYQMMGQMVHDPDGLEGKKGSSPGLGLLPIETTLQAPKTTTLTVFSWEGEMGTGYEIHMGQTKQEQGKALFRIKERNAVSCDDVDGCYTKNGSIMGTYIHGLFDTPGITKRWLKGIGLGHILVEEAGGLLARNKEYNHLLKHFVKHVDVGKIARLVQAVDGKI